MAVDFTKKPDPWVDVPDPSNPPASASKVMADDLNRYEDALEGLAAESGAIEVDTSAGTKVTVGGHVVFYDSGWRQIRDHLAIDAEGNTSGTTPDIYIKRENSTVWLSFDNFNLIEPLSSTQTFLNIPLGFAPQRPVRLGEGATYELGTGLYTSGSDLRVRSSVTEGRRRFYVSWSASSTLPTSLPGTPA